VSTARYGLMPYINQITFRLLKVNVIMAIYLLNLTVSREVSVSLGWGTRCPGRLALLSSLAIQVQVLGHNFFSSKEYTTPHSLIVLPLDLTLTAS
jgi:hypothetical protein